jgi:hypothetical protein
MLKIVKFDYFERFKASVGDALRHLFLTFFLQTKEGKEKIVLMLSVCFDVKWFLENDFGIFRCLVGAKIMINRKMISV